MGITRRQRQILDFIKNFLEQKQYSPTLEEIARHFGMASLNGVYKHLAALEERGLIHRLSHQARSIRLAEEPSGSRRVPLLGSVAAGGPIEAVRNPEEISVPESFLTRGPNFVLKVRGDSMIEEHIQDGDFVVLEQRRQAQNGEMVVALIDGDQATLKKYFREGGKIRLQPANAALEALVLDEERVQVQGVVVGILRKYR